MTTLPKRGLPALIAGSALIGSLAFAGTALAAGPGGFEHGARPAIAGTVASAPDASGTFTVTAIGWRHGSGTTTPTAYTVDTTGATTVTKNGAASTVSAIAAGDKVMVHGTVSGTTVTATSIRDGMRGMPGHKPGTNSAAPLITGNGQPVIGGSITAISGTTLTVTAKSGIAYSVNAAAAEVIRMGTTSALSTIATGDSVIVQGAVNGTSVTASSIIDQGARTNVSGEENPGQHRGFLGAVGGFFSHLFGFF